MKADWEVLAEEPDDAPAGSTPWWRVHVPTLLGAVIMTAAALVAIAGAAVTGGARSWLAALGFATNAVCLVGIAKARHMMRMVEGDTRKYAPVSDLGPWGRREWWLTLVAFAGFLVGVVALLTA